LNSFVKSAEGQEFRRIVVQKNTLYFHRVATKNGMGFPVCHNMRWLSQQDEYKQHAFSLYISLMLLSLQKKKVNNKKDKAI